MDNVVQLLASIGQNLAMIISLTFIYSSIWSWLKRQKPTVSGIIIGLLFGMLGIVAMLIPVRVAPGVIVDVRMILATISGIYGGFIPGLISGLIISGYRFWLGGPGAPAGIGSILSGAAIGIWLYYRFTVYRKQVKPLYFILVGLFLAIESLLLLLITLPTEMAISTVTDISYSLLIGLPLATFFLGLLFSREQQRLNMIEDLEANEDRLRAVFTHTREGISVSKNGIHLMGNPALVKIFGCRDELEVIGKPILDFIAPRDREKVGDNIEKRNRGEYASPEYMIRAMHQDGSEFDLEVNISSYKVGDEVYTIAIHRDITEQRTAKEEIQRLNSDLERRVEERTAQLEAANRDLESFSYSVSHDLRTPLRAIDGFSRILEEDYIRQLPDDAVRYLQRIRKAAHKMDELVNDLLSFSRLGRQPLKKLVVSVHDVVNQALEEMGTEADRDGLEVKVGELPICMADPALLRQVYVNLISNAMKFTRKCNPAVIEIGCFDQGGKEILYVKDNGIGFDMNYTEKLFGVFQRMHPLEDYEGTGVGLAIVKRIIEQHEGHVWAEAEPGKGAAFYFTLGETVES